MLGDQVLAIKQLIYVAFCILVPKPDRNDGRERKAYSLGVGWWGWGHDGWDTMEQRTSSHGGEGEEKKQREQEEKPVVVGFSPSTLLWGILSHIEGGSQFVLSGKALSH